tara:strand:+ start:16853 stop:17362 length:510 start_codon:yes stop_codon:yes gene_type:complete
MSDSGKAIVFNARSARAIEDIVLRMMASDPMRRKPPRKQPRQGKSQFVGVLGVAMEDISACEVKSHGEVSQFSEENYNPGTDRPPDAPSYILGAGKVQAVQLFWGAAGKDDSKNPGLRAQGVYDGASPRVETWYNMVPAPVHRGQLLQGKRFPMDSGDYITIVDVEPCD